MTRIPLRDGVGRGPCARQTGATLLMALFVLLCVTMVALAAARIAFDAERTARAARDRQLAFQAAEAGLADAERDIAGGAHPGAARAAMFHDDGAIGFEAGCGRGAVNLGLCAVVPGALPAWQVADTDASVPYGSFTGAVLPYGGPLPLVRAGEDAGRPGTASQGLFRITAFGYGALPGTLVVLQSVYRGSAAPGALP